MANPYHDNSQLQQSIDTFGTPAWTNGDAAARSDIMAKYQEFSNAEQVLPLNSPEYASGFGGLSDPGAGYDPTAGLAGTDYGALTNPTEAPSLLDNITSGKYGGLEGWGQIGRGLGSIGSAYAAYKQYGIASDQLDFTKASANRNFANQAVVTNEMLASKQRARNRYSGGRGPAPARVDGSPLG